jgi:AcrR family transcriptional regulator
MIIEWVVLSIYFERLTKFILTEYELIEWGLPDFGGTGFDIEWRSGAILKVMVRAQQKEQTRRSIIRQTEEYFGSKGIGLTSTADIARALKISHGTIFLHFPTRDELVKTVIDEFGERLSESLRSRIGEMMPLGEMLKAHLAVIADIEGLYLQLISEIQNFPPSFRSILFAINASLSYRFFRAAEKEMKDGTLKEIDQPMLFSTWIAIVHYHIQNRDLLSDTHPICKEKSECMINQFLTLLKT